MHAGRGCSGTGTVYGIPRCTSQYSGNGPSLYEVMCISCWDEERGKENTATSVDSLIHLGVMGLVGFTWSVPAPHKAFSVPLFP